MYVPIDQRAAKLHSMKISQRILNEENNKIKKMKEEENIIKKKIYRDIKYLTKKSGTIF